MRTATDLAAAARAAGLSLDQVEQVAMPGLPGGAIVSRMSFEDPWAAARLLKILTDQDASDPIVRAWSLAILQATAEAIGEDASGSTLTPELRDAFAQAIPANVQAQIKFVHEPTETFQSARVTMALGAGDCDDHARLVYALAAAGGLQARLYFYEDDDQPIHVVAKIQDSSGWQWVETTIDAEYGEEPFAALERLAPDAENDPFAQPGAPSPSTAGMGFLGLDFVTPGNVATRKAELDQTVKSLIRDVAACTTLDAGTRASFNDFAFGWSTFMLDTPNWFNVGGQGRQAGEFTDQIVEWQTRLAGLCTTSAPVIPASKGDPIVSALSAVAVVVVAGAAAWTFAPSVRTMLERRRGHA